MAELWNSLNGRAGLVRPFRFTLWWRWWWWWCSRCRYTTQFVSCLCSFTPSWKKHLDLVKPFKNQLKPLTNPVKRRITQEKFHLNFENADRFPSRMTSRSTHYQEPTVKTAINLDIFVYIPLKRVRPYCPRFEAPSDPTCCRRKKTANEKLTTEWNRIGNF